MLIRFSQLSYINDLTNLISQGGINIIIIYQEKKNKYCVSLTEYVNTFFLNNIEAKGCHIESLLVKTPLYEKSEIQNSAVDAIYANERIYVLQFHI